jgi:hypothetical protein
LRYLRAAVQVVPNEIKELAQSSGLAPAMHCCLPSGHHLKEIMK